MIRFRWFGLVLGLLMAAVAQAQTTLQTDEQTLKNHHLPTDAKGLIDFFQKRSMKEGDEKRLRILVQRLDSDAYLLREASIRELIGAGRSRCRFCDRPWKAGFWRRNDRRRGAWRRSRRRCRPSQSPPPPAFWPPARIRVPPRCCFIFCRPRAAILFWKRNCSPALDV